MAVDVLTDIMIRRPQNLVATCAGDRTNASPGTRTARFHQPWWESAERYKMV
jgi:hypothetical protein